MQPAAHQRLPAAGVPEQVVVDSITLRDHRFNLPTTQPIDAVSGTRDFEPLLLLLALGAAAGAAAATLSLYFV